MKTMRKRNVDLNLNSDFLEGKKMLSALDLVHSCFNGEILFGLFLCVRTGKV